MSSDLMFQANSPSLEEDGAAISPPAKEKTPVTERIRKAVQQGMVIPACPLALNRFYQFDERRQRAIIRYYHAAGAGGLAVAVHTTQFEIRNPAHGLYEPLLALAADELDKLDQNRDLPAYRIAGVCGPSRQAIQEASLAADLGYAAGLVSLANLKDSSEDALIRHCREIAEVIPIWGFYLQPACGGPILPYSFWRKFCEIPNVAGIKIAPFNRYRTSEVLRAVADSGRQDLALYTGNDDNIVCDLVTTYQFPVEQGVRQLRMTGGLLGHWAVWTQRAVVLQKELTRIREGQDPPTMELLKLGTEITDANGAIFDAANGYKGCIAGIHEVLRRQGLLEGIWLLDPKVSLAKNQRQEINRVYQAYPHLNDDQFVAEHIDEWLK